MRPIERIDNFLIKVDWEKLTERWKLNIPIKGINRKTRTYWKQNPDMRIGQVLINLGLIPDTLIVWNDEEYDILNDQGLNPREFLYWKSYYDKYNNLLEEPVYKLIKDLDTDHLYAIIDFYEKRMKPKPQIILDEIEYREQKKGTD